MKGSELRIRAQHSENATIAFQTGPSLSGTDGMNELNFSVRRALDAPFQHGHAALWRSFGQWPDIEEHALQFLLRSLPRVNLETL